MLLLLGIWQFNNLQDWWVLRSYEPTEALRAIAERNTMTPSAERRLYTARAELNSKPVFAKNCPVTEQALVLGCYANGRIYILEVERSELAKVVDVTAAHEMLHGAYERLSGKERTKVNKLLNEYFANVTDQELIDLIKEYDRSEPGQRQNELHSILGTQVENLSPELEAYYLRYFDDRRVVVNSYLAYEGVFESIKSQQASLKAQLDDLGSRLKNLDSNLDTQRIKLEETSNLLETYKAANDINSYNELVPMYNSLTRQYNSDAKLRYQLAVAYNQKVEQFNNLSVKQSDLIDTLDSSKYQSQ